MVVINIQRFGSVVNVEFDNGELVKIPYELFVQLSIYKEDIIDEQQLSEVKEKIDRFKIKQSALRYLSNRNHTKYELRVKLVKKDFDKNNIQIVLGELERYGYINDQNFAELYFKSQIKRKRGIQKIKASLFKKGVNREIIENTSQQFFDDPLILESAKILADKKYKMLQHKNNTSQQLRQKLYNYLAQRGYSFDIISKVVENINFKKGNNE